jgi:hypothetical protein
MERRWPNARRLGAEVGSVLLVLAPSDSCVIKSYNPRNAVKYSYLGLEDKEGRLMTFPNNKSS